VVNHDHYKKASAELLLHLGVRIRSIRRTKKWTQETLAEKAGINDKEVSHIEAGSRNITIETLVKLSIALDIEPEQLVSSN